MDVLVHGGAGPARDKPTGALETAARCGSEVDDPVAAVVAAITVLEDDPAFNAGIGSAVQSDGRIRTDAGLMSGDGAAGAACGMPGVAHAIEVAAGVRARTPHVLLCGQQAGDFAAELGVDADVDLWTDRTRARWAGEHLVGASFDSQLDAVRDRFGGSHDTVGAVAREGDRVAAGASTGGRWLALAGRVGDVPQVGSGFYASRAGAVSTTGAGEGIAEATLARLAERALDHGADSQAAADQALAAFESRDAGAAGLILITPDGSTGTAYSSETMETAFASA